MTPGHITEDASQVHLEDVYFSQWKIGWHLTSLIVVCGSENQGNSSRGGADFIVPVVYRCYGVEGRAIVI